MFTACKLGDLEQRRDRLDANTVLLVDEAGMVGTRKLARLLDEASRAEAKVILIGDDRQLSSIDAGEGFRGLRLRLGASKQGLTKWTSLPFVSGREDAQWLYVVLSRAKHLSRIYTVTGPEERPAELQKVPDNRRVQDGYERLAAAMGRNRAEQLATDARRLVDLRPCQPGSFKPSVTA